MENADEQKRLALAANAARAIEGRYFLRYLIVGILALVALGIWYTIEKQRQK